MQRWSFSVLLGAIAVLWLAAVWVGLERRRESPPRQSAAQIKIGAAAAKAPLG